MKNVELKKKFEEKYEKVMHELKSDLELEVKETNEGINAAYKFTHEGQKYGDNINILEEELEKENEYLRAENEYLKKLNALVQKRKGRQPKKK